MDILIVFVKYSLTYEMDKLVSIDIRARVFWLSHVLFLGTGYMEVHTCSQE